MRNVKDAQSELINNFTQDIQNVLAPNLKKLRGFEKLVLVVIPQLQLIPYVYGLLLSENMLFRDNIVLLYNRSLIFPKKLFEDYPNIIKLDIRFARNCEELYSRCFFDVLIQYSIKVSVLILHNFAGSINKEFALRAMDNSIMVSEESWIAKEPKFLYYSDGSRNNALPEVTLQEGSDFFSLSQSLNLNSYFFFYGFRHFKYSQHQNEKVLSYDFVQAAFTAVMEKISVKISGNLQYDSRSLVVCRYWGRDPYFFKESQCESTLSLYIKSVTNVLPRNLPVVIRGDNRVKEQTNKIVSCLSDDEYDVMQFDDLFESNNLDGNQLLLENFFFSSIEIVRSFRMFYCFDSSFPLVFQNRFLYCALAQDAEIYLGFSKKLVMEYGVGECYRVMRQRTLETVYSVLQTGLFNCFVGKKLIASPSIDNFDLMETLEKSFENSEGYFCLVKP